MPCLTAAFDPSIGPLLAVLITPAGAIQKLAVGGPAPTSPGDGGTVITPVLMLIDTGADATCISPQLAQQLNLKSLGLRPVGGATGAALRNKYLVDVGIPFPGGQTTPGTVVSAFTIAVPNIEVIEFVGRSPHFQGLLGRDILLN